MAQHDYNIANQIGADFRADLNNALLAIASNNSGSSEPSTTFAYEWWIDTSSNVLKLRNSSNNAWITMPFSITADNTVDINAGTVNGITSLSFSSGSTVASILDEDNLSSDSATALATQQSIKAYVDSQVTAQDLDITDGSSTIDIDLDSETLSLLGGTGVTSTASGSGVTFAIDSTVATLSGSQALTNKTLDVDNNTLSNIELDNLKSGVLDTDLSSVAATDTTIASAKAIKTYVDANITAQDLDISDGSSTIAIDLDSETLSLLGGTGVTSTASGNGVTFAIGQSVGTSDNVVFNQVTGALVGNSSTATALATARTISGVSFDGSANITLDTDDIGEGSTNLYYTNERVDDEVNSLLTAGTGISLSYNDGANTLTITNTNSADITSVVAGDGLTGGGTSGDVTLAVGVDDSSIEINSDALRVKASGITNAMLGGSIANAKLSNSSVTINSQAISLGGSHTFNTDAIGEGSSNLYFTNERTDDRVANLIQDGTGISFTYDDTAGTLTPLITLAPFDTDNLSEGSSNLYYTNARANSAIDARVTNTFINNLSGVVADTSTALATARTIAVAGDVVGSASFDGTADISISTTIQANSVALGTDTTGNYIQTITGTANKVSVSGSGSESADVTLTLPSDVQIANDLTVAGDLTVNGDLTYLDTTNLKIEDNLFELNANLTGSPVNDSGMLINRGNQNNAVFIWDESADKFTLGLTTADGTATGNITLASLGTLVANLEGAVTGTVSSISNHSTSDLSEGTNLYFTNARARSAISASGDISYNSSTGVISFTQSTAPVTSVNSATGAVVLDTDDVGEGSSNLYFTNARARSAISESSTQLAYNSSTGVLTYTQGDTDTVGEGSNNLYFTNERVDDRVATFIQNGTGISWSYNDGSNTFTPTISLSSFDTDNLSEGSSNLYYTDARANSAIDARVTNTFINNLSGVVADTATALANARTIGGVSFDGTANIDLAGVNSTGNQDTSGNAATATILATARTIGGTSFDGSANIAVALASTATTLASARTINGVSFDGSANITTLTAGTGVAVSGTEVSIGQAVATSSSPTFSNMTLSGTDSIKVPAGTTGQRNGSPANGMFRYNSTNEEFEGYQNGAWGAIAGGGSSGSFSTNIFAGDGSDTTFTLSAAPSNENNLLVFVDGVFQAHNVYSVSGTTLTFATAPVNGRVITVYNAEEVSIGTPSDNSVSTVKIVDDAVNAAKIAGNAVGITQLNVSDGSAGQFLKTDGSGTLSFATVSGTTINNNANNRVITGSGTANTLEGEANFVFDGTNVGIGTASPSSKLQIMGGTSGVDQISLSSNLNDNTAKDAGIIMTMYTNNTAALIGGLAVNGNTSLVYGSSGTDHRGVTLHKWYTNTNYNSTSGNTERMRMNSSGQLGIACTDQSNLLTVDANSASAGTDSISVRNRGVAGVNHTAGLRFQFGTAVPAAIRSELKNTTNGQGSLQFLTSTDGTAGNLTQRAFIDTAGRFTFGGNFAHDTYGHVAVFGANSVPSGTIVVEDFDVSSGIGNTVMKCFLRDQDPATLATFIQFADGGGQVGSITHNDDGGGVSFNTTSDYRLKENVNYTWEALPLLTQLKPAKFNFKRNPAKTIQGMLAHEVQDIVPSSVRGDKDQIMPIGTVKDSEGNTIYEGVYEHFCKTDEKQTWTQTGTEPLYQNLDYSRLVPLLTKSIQEQQTLIESLTARIDQMENK